jgi:hypothetical protein
MTASPSPTATREAEYRAAIPVKMQNILGVKHKPGTRVSEQRLGPLGRQTDELEEMKVCCSGLGGLHGQ